MKIFNLLFTAVLVAMTGCQSHPKLALEPQRPFALAEPVYLLKPSDFAIRDFTAIFIPQAIAKPATAPVINVREAGPEGTTVPHLALTSKRVLRTILAELPPYLPKQAVFLISSRGTVVEVVFQGARDHLNERLFAARLRTLIFVPATLKQVPIAVVWGIDLVSAAAEPSKASATPGSVMNRAGARSAPILVAAAYDVGVVPR